MDENKNQEKRFADYSAPEPGSYNLNGTYYKSSQQYTGAGDSTDNSRYDSPDSGVGSYSTGEEYNTQYSGSQYNGAQYNESQYTGTQNTADTFSYGNGNYSYNPNQQPPLDGKGRPLRNRFGMKLTFSILGILGGLFIMCGSLLIGAIPLVLSIVALVFTCLQNREYKAGNWDSFRHFAKLSAILLWIDLGLWVIYLILLIIGVIVVLVFGNKYMDILNQSGNDLYFSEYVEETQAEAEPETGEEEPGEVKKPSSGSFSGFRELEGQNLPMVKGFNQFTLQGTEISLPMDMSDFCSAGFHLGEDDMEETLEAGDSYGYGYYDESDSYLGTVFVYNTTDQDIHPQDGIAGGITISNYGNCSLKLVGDLSFASNKADAAAVFGEDVTSMHEDDGYGYYSWYFKDGGYYTSIELDFDGEELKEVWIMNCQQLEE
ncbi:MAG: hypothetical protein MR508_05910 [Lachnospiraceae bacterium]|nr:hypothetical protein [Lachnospiraceae bacterium]